MTLDWLIAWLQDLHDNIKGSQNREAKAELQLLINKLETQGLTVFPRRTLRQARELLDKAAAMQYND